MSQTIFYPPPPPDPALAQGVILRRFVALLLDLLGISVLTWAAAIFVAIFGLFTLGLGWLAFHLLWWMPVAYYTLLIGGTGATPGQRLAGIVLRQDATMAPPNMAQALVWTLLLWVSFALSGLPFLLALLNPRRRAAHDVLSGLTIVRAPHFPY